MINIIYQSKEVKRRVLEKAREKFHIKIDRIGLITIDIEKRMYTKKGIDFYFHEITYTVFDMDLKSLGLITERELRD